MYLHRFNILFSNLCIVCLNNFLPCVKQFYDFSRLFSDDFQRMNILLLLQKVTLHAFLYEDRGKDRIMR